MYTNNDLVTAKNNLAGALGDNMKLYLQLLKSWFKQKTNREDFDHEARKLLSMDSVHLHNQFILAILAKCQSLGSPLGKGTVQASVSSVSQPSSPSKQKKVKTRKRALVSTSKVSFQQRFLPVNPLITSPHIPDVAPEADERGPAFLSRELLLPDVGLVHCRLLISAWEHGLEDIQDETAALLIKAIQVQLKNILSAVFSRRSGYKVREKRFKFAFGTEASLSNSQKSSSLEEYWTESEGTSVTDKGYHVPTVKPSPEVGLQNAAIQTASASSPPAKYKVNLMDLYSALQVHKSAIPSHTVYATNMERIAQRMWHFSNEELKQEQTHKQQIKNKQDLQTRHQLSAISFRT